LAKISLSRKRNSTQRQRKSTPGATQGFENAKSPDENFRLEIGKSPFLQIKD